MRILLTGAAGQVGSALVPLLKPRATVVTPALEEFDLSRPAELAAKLDDLKPDLIINPAAYTAVDKAEDEPALAQLINSDAPAAIAKWAARHHAPLIHFSTDYVFDGSGREPRREDSATGPLSVYGASKLGGDRAVATSGAPYLIVRTSWVYAATGANFLMTIARLAKERKELRIVADQIGAPTSARTIADIVAKIIPTEPASMDAVFERQTGVVNVVCAGETSWHGFASAIVAGLKARGMDLLVETIVPIRTDEFPVKANRPANSRLSLERLREDFRLETPTWQRALECELDIMMAAAF